MRKDTPYCIVSDSVTPCKFIQAYVLVLVFVRDHVSFFLRKSLVHRYVCVAKYLSNGLDNVSRDFVSVANIEAFVKALALHFVADGDELLYRYWGIRIEHIFFHF